MEAPEFFQGTAYCSQLTPEKPTAGGDHFIVEDLLDFSNEDAVITDVANFNSSVAGHSTDSSTVTAVESCNSSSFSGPEPNLGGAIGCRSFTDGQFAGDLCVPVIKFFSYTCIDEILIGYFLWSKLKRKSLY